MFSWEIDKRDGAPGLILANSDMGRAKRGPRNSVTKAVIIIIRGFATLDDCVLNGLARSLEESLGFGPEDIGALLLLQSLTKAGGAPIWAALSDAGWQKRRMIAFCAFGWMGCSVGFVFASQFWHWALLKFLNGIFLSCMGPLTQAIMAECCEEKDLAVSYGYVQAAVGMGGFIGGFSAPLGEMTIFGIAGWRVAFLCLALLCSQLGFLALLGIDHDDEKCRGSRRADSCSLVVVLGKFLVHLRNPVMFFLFVIGFLNDLAFSTWGFWTEWFEYLGLSPAKAASIGSSAALAMLVGGPLGGFVCDWLHSHWPLRGRFLTGQISLCIAVLCMMLWFKILPKDPALYGYFWIVSVVFGTFGAWVSFGVNSTLLAVLVVSDQKASAFAVYEIFLMLSSVGSALTGALSARFGYIVTKLNISEMDPSLRIGNRDALGHAMALVTCSAWSLAFLLFGIMHLLPSCGLVNVRHLAKEPIAADMLGQVSETSESTVSSLSTSLS